MDLLRRIGDLLSPSPAEEASDEADRGPVERSAPGVRAMFERVSEEAGHAVLDLGSASGASLRVYRRFADRVQFADLLAVRARQGFTVALDSLPDRPERPFDLIFTWHTLDRLRPRERERLVERLAELSAPGARLHAVVGGVGGRAGRRDEASEVPHRFGLLDTGRIRYEHSGRREPYRERMLPADVEELLGPFSVARGFTLRSGLREYVAARGDRGS